MVGFAVKRFQRIYSLIDWFRHFRGFTLLPFIPWMIQIFSINCIPNSNTIITRNVFITNGKKNANDMELEQVKWVSHNERKQNYSYCSPVATLSTDTCITQPRVILKQKQSYRLWNTIQCFCSKYCIYWFEKQKHLVLAYLRNQNNSRCFDKSRDSQLTQ